MELCTEHDMAHETRNCEVLYHAAASINLYMLTYLLY